MFLSPHGITSIADDFQLILPYHIYTNLIGLIKMTGNEKKLKLTLDHTAQIHLPTIALR